MKGYARNLVILIVLLLSNYTLFGQAVTDPEELFTEGEYFFLSEEYEEALYYYLQLIEIFPEHANFNFKAGMTYLQIPGQEFLSIPYLEKAITRTSIKYKKRKFKEKNAPHHAYFRLGNAYRHNNELEKALEIYEIFVNSKDFEGNYNLRIVETEIASCNRAKIIRDDPVNANFTKLEDPVNSSSDNTNAVLSGDGNTMIFVTELKFYDAIHLSKKIDGKWTSPEVLNPQVGSDGDFYPTALSFDGRELFMVRRAEENDDLYVSTLGESFWSKAIPLNSYINTRAHETHASLSKDGNALYFTSARRGGSGNLDIYRSERNPSGDWGEAVNLGPEINTSEDEDAPFLTAEGKRLIFCSKGHFNMGGYDIFYSDLETNGKWTDPVNIGYPINTTGDDLFFYPIGNGLKGYMAKVDRDGPLTFDIYHVDILDQEVIQPGADLPVFNRDFIIKIYRPETGDTLFLHYNKEKDMIKSSDPSYSIIVDEGK
jgi:tetratricopeptide (TPR) repeat protein